MLLRLTTTHRPATDLGYLLHKHPGRLQEVPLPFGQARVVYPEATEERCTAALLLEIDPVALVRRNAPAAALEPYVNDRPYVASSFLSVALGRRRAPQDGSGSASVPGDMPTPNRSRPSLPTVLAALLLAGGLQAGAAASEAAPRWTVDTGG